MHFDILTICEDITVEVALRYLRRMGSLPHLTDKLSVFYRNDILLGLFQLKRMVVNVLRANVADIIAPDAVVFHSEDIRNEAVSAFSVMI